MRTPKENPEGYDDNPITRAPNLRGKLLICQGTADDNVHYRNVAEYTEALVQADKDYMQLSFTNRNHGISGGNTRNFLFRNIAQWFKRNLQK
jgi:dipeptidyl-peptidase-4